jgi:hypothetical protein
VIQCVPAAWGFAHVCDGCGAVGPVVGAFPVQRDAAEAAALGVGCRGGVVDGGCRAAAAGWLTGGERDLCPVCRAVGS